MRDGSAAMLASIDAWEVDNVAAASFDAGGILASHGDGARPFALASVSKILTAIAVHVAVEEGTIGLDDDVTPAGGPEGSTVRHLLAHASDLAPDGDRRALGPPEHRRIYSNIGFEILGDHLAAAAGMSATDYIGAALVDSLGLRSTTITGSPAHAFTSSVDDLVTVTGAVLDGRLLSPATVAAMTTPAHADLAGVLPGFGPQDPNPWGLGVEVRGTKAPHWTAPDNSPRTWGHFGRAGTFLWWDPDAERGLVVLTDREFGPWAAEAWPVVSSAVLAG